MRRQGSQQHRGGSLPSLQVSLHYIAAHRVAHQHRRLPGLADDLNDGLAEVSHVVRAALPAQRAYGLALSVVAKAEGIHLEAALSKVAEEMLVPAPRAVPPAMHELHRRSAGRFLRCSGNKLQIHDSLL